MKKNLNIFGKAITLCSIILSLFFSLVNLPASAQNTSKQDTKSTEVPPTRILPKQTFKLNEPVVNGPGGLPPIRRNQPKIEVKLDEPVVNGPGGIYHPKQKVKD